MCYMSEFIGETTPLVDSEPPYNSSAHAHDHERLETVFGAANKKQLLL
jgi:hypothetical protein